MVYSDCRMTYVAAGDFKTDAKESTLSPASCRPRSASSTLPSSAGTPLPPCCSSSRKSPQLTMQPEPYTQLHSKPPLILPAFLAQARPKPKPFSKGHQEAGEALKRLHRCSHSQKKATQAVRMCRKTCTHTHTRTLLPAADSPGRHRCIPPTLAPS